jgi:D-3-phosphoglycerate dehydrogenase
VQFDRDLREGAWATHEHHMDRILRGPVPPLRELTVGIVGIGRIGSAVAARLAPFGVKLIAFDPYLDADTIRDNGAEPVSLEELLQASDIVTLHCPLTPETQGMLDAAALATMKPTAMLVNTARGPIVDLDALGVALENQRLGGAALDVVYPEPLPLDSPLYSLPNVILTPHAAYYSERSVQVIRTETLMAAVDVLQGRQPKVVANPAVLPRVSLAPAR